MLLKNIAPIGQRDNRWKDKKLGTSTTTIGNAGCVLCSATVICRFYGKNIFPDWLNEQMVKVNGYYDKNLWQWHKLADIFPDIKVHKLIDCYTTPLPKRNKQTLREGHPVIVCVDFDLKLAFKPTMLSSLAGRAMIIILLTRGITTWRYSKDAMATLLKPFTLSVCMTGR